MTPLIKWERQVDEEAQNIGGNTGRKFELAVKRRLEKDGAFVLDLTAEKVRLPDLVAWNSTGKPIFFECKCYLSCKTANEAFNRWNRKQPDQVKSFYDLIVKKQNIIVVFKTQEGITSFIGKKA